MIQQTMRSIRNPVDVKANFCVNSRGFGQEMNVRQRVDEKAAGAFGGWSDLNLMRNTYTHAEDAQGKINHAMLHGLHKAETNTGLKLRKEP